MFKFLTKSSSIAITFLNITSVFAIFRFLCQFAGFLNEFMCVLRQIGQRFSHHHRWFFSGVTRIFFITWKADWINKQHSLGTDNHFFLNNIEKIPFILQLKKKPWIWWFVFVLTTMLLKHNCRLSKSQVNTKPEVITCLGNYLTSQLLRW